MARGQLKHRAAGFTLIELIVVSGLLSLLLITISTMFMTAITVNGRTTIRQQVKGEGSAVLGTIEFLLRNALQLQPNLSGQTCANNMASIKFLNVDGRSTTFLTESAGSAARIASNSGQYLTSTDVDVQNLRFDCQRNSGGEYSVNVTFTLQSNTSTAVTESFRHLVMLRNR